MRKIILPFLFFVASIILAGCEKTNSPKDITITEAVEAIAEYATVNKMFQDAGNGSGDAILSAKTLSKSKSNGSEITTQEDPVITVNPIGLTTFPKTITVDFKTGITCKDGVTRKGKMQIISTNWYGELNSKHTTTFDSFYQNGYKVEGTHITTNLGNNTDGNLRFSVRIDDGKITTPEGGVINYKEDSFRTWIKGKETPLNIWDDEYLLEGTQSGISSSDIEYTLEVKDPLHFILMPRSVVSGILNISIANFKDIEIDYAKSTVTVNGVSYPFAGN
jgi:hypothetical protein